MLFTTWQGITALVVGGFATFIVLPMMADYYANASWSSVSAAGISARDSTMQLWQFVPLFVGVVIFAAMFFRVGRKETTEEAADW